MRKHKVVVPPEVAPVLEALEKIGPHVEAFTKWLYAVAVTKPFTLRDALELKAMIDRMLGPEAIVDVYTTRGDQVFVRAQIGGTIIERVLDVV